MTTYVRIKRSMRRSTASERSERTRRRTSTTTTYIMAPKIRFFLAFILLVLDHLSLLVPSFQRIATCSAEKPKPHHHHRQQHQQQHQQTTPTIHKNARTDIGAAHQHLKSPSSTTTTPNNKKSSSLVEVYEHEYYDRQKLEWLGGDGLNLHTNSNTTSTTNAASTNSSSSSSSAESSTASTKTQRWTSSALPSHRDANAKYLPPPSQLPPPRGYEYSSDWKIDVTGKSKDELGWEYFIDHKEGIGRRRRRWLRTVSLLETASVTAVEKKKTSGSSSGSSGSTTSTSIVPKVPTTASKIPQHRRTATALKRSGTSTSTRFRTPTTIKITPKIIKELQDSFNFKGYGLNVYKSILYRNACGIGWRLPLTPNFEFMESRPYLPVISSSVILYYPLRLSLLLNASLPVELFQCCVYALLDWCMWSILVLQCMVKTVVMDFMGRLIVWNSLKALGRILAFGEVPNDDNGDDSDLEEEEEKDKLTGSSSSSLSSTTSATKKKKQRVGSLFSSSLATESSAASTDLKDTNGMVILGRLYPSIPTRRQVTYHQGISDRLGLSLSAQISEQDGIQFRWSWWHAYLPTIDFLGSTMGNFVATLTKKKPRVRGDVVSEWLRQKFASLGVSWGGFTPDPPYYSCSAIFSLSGFYYNGEALRKFCSGMLVKATLGVAEPSTSQKNEKKNSMSSADRSKAKLDSRLRRDGLDEMDVTDVSSAESEMELINVKVGAR